MRSVMRAAVAVRLLPDATFAQDACPLRTVQVVVPIRPEARSIRWSDHINSRGFEFIEDDIIEHAVARGAGGGLDGLLLGVRYQFGHGVHAERALDLSKGQIFKVKQPGRTRCQSDLQSARSLLLEPALSRPI